MKRFFVAVLALAFVLTFASCKVRPGSGTNTSASPEASQSASPPASAEPSANKHVIMLRGTIGDFPVHMSLKISDGRVTGTYYYDSVGKELKLEGTTEANRMIYMDEYDENGQRTGSFDGWYTHGIRIAGSWKNAQTDKTLDFSLKVIGGIPADAVWAGEWHRMDTGRFNSATLAIYSETVNGFDFQMDAFSGANMGFLDGSATLGGAVAHYKNESTGAELSFSLEGSVLIVQANDAADGQAGAGVTFSGRFTKGDLPSDTLLSLGYVSSQSQEDAFKAMAGDDYLLFLDTANIPTEREDSDGLGAVVNAWFVHGFGDYYVSIVMLLPDGTLCAGVVDRESNVIKVYTNNPLISAVPKTIQAWIDGLEELPVRFYNTAKN